MKWENHWKVLEGYSECSIENRKSEGRQEWKKGEPFRRLPINQVRNEMG